MKKIQCLLLTAGMCVAASTHASTSLSIDSKSDSSAPREMMMDNAVVTDAMREFRSLSRVERKMRIKEAKKTLKELKAQKAAGEDVSTNTVLLAILAVLLPPLAVGLHEHELNGKFWLSVLLTLLFWLPGVIYALIVVLS